jgi:hypothetical protein
MIIIVFKHNKKHVKCWVTIKVTVQFVQIFNARFQRVLVVSVLFVWKLKKHNVTLLVARSMVVALFVLKERVMLHLPEHVALERFVRSKTNWIVLLLAGHIRATQQRAIQALVQVVMARVVQVNLVLLIQK